MKVTYKELVENLLPAFKRLQQMQGQGAIVLHNIVADGVNRNYRVLQTFLQPHMIRETEILKKHVISESKMSAISFKTVGQHPNVDFDYKKTLVPDTSTNPPTQIESPDFHREECTKEMEAEKDKTIDWTPVKIKEDEIAMVHNFPMDVYNQFSQFEIITTLDLPDQKILTLHKKN